MNYDDLQINDLITVEGNGCVILELPKYGENDFTVLDTVTGDVVQHSPQEDKVHTKVESHETMDVRPSDLSLLGKVVCFAKLKGGTPFSYQGGNYIKLAKEWRSGILAFRVGENGLVGSVSFSDQHVRVVVIELCFKKELENS